MRGDFLYSGFIGLVVVRCAFSCTSGRQTAADEAAELAVCDASDSSMCMAVVGKQRVVGSIIWMFWVTRGRLSDYVPWEVVYPSTAGTCYGYRIAPIHE